MQKSSVAGRTFVEVMEYLFNRCSAADVETYAEVARRLWFRRNSIVHGGECTHPNILVSSTVAFIADYRATLDTQETVMHSTPYRDRLVQLGGLLHLQVFSR